MEQEIFEWLETYMGEAVAARWSVWLAALGVCVLAWVSYVVCVRVLTPLVDRITRATETEWDDDLLNAKVLRAASQLVPAILVSCMLPETFGEKTALYIWAGRLTRLYILWAATRLILVFMRGVQEGVDRRHLFKRHNLEILRQTLVFFVVAVAVIVGVGILINRDPVAILTALGASAAVLMLVFRDTLLNFMAGIQLTVNKMLGRGDWIVAPKAGINGEVIEVKLVTVKVRNWDNSIVTVPPYTLFTDSFQNFQGMRQAGARRVSRSVLFDIDSIRRLGDDEVARLTGSGRLTPELVSKAPGRVNLTLFRHYMESYLESHPEIISDNPEATLMVRQLQPEAQGVPVELYFFTTRTQWKPFEHLQADVFDHLYSVVAEFGLRIYQSPSGHDVARLGEGRLMNREG